jgi:hypothetical protein
MLLTSFPVRGSDRTTLVMRTGRSAPAAKTAPAVKMGIPSLKQKLRKMFSLFLERDEPESAIRFPKPFPKQGSGGNP